MKSPFDFRLLMTKVGATTAEEMADRCGLNRKGVYNRLARGVNWIEADELAVRCGLLPWEVWPSWLDSGVTEQSTPAADGRRDSTRSIAIAA